MRVVHFARVTPKMCGLYETTRDLVAAERALGIDARILDSYATVEDRGVPIGDVSCVGAADVIVSHSGLGRLAKIDKPVIQVLHGRPESSFLLEQQNKVPVLSIMSKLSTDARVKKFVTFWPEFVDHWAMLIPREKLVVVPPPVDLKAWSPDGPKGYQFGGKRGGVNVVIADMWREDKTPYQAVVGFANYAETHEDARLHIYGLNGPRKGLDVLLGKLDARGVLGEVKGMIDGLANVYRAADVVLTPHRIATRSIREAMACGCPVVGSSLQCAPSLFVYNPEDPAEYAAALESSTIATRQTPREVAKEQFDSAKTAEAFKAIFEDIIGQSEGA